MDGSRVMLTVALLVASMDEHLACHLGLQMARQLEILSVGRLEFQSEIVTPSVLGFVLEIRRARTRCTSQNLTMFQLYNSF